jgi:hypothetical protein
MNEIFLVIFRQVVLINAPAGIGGDRADTNYFNAVLIVSVVQTMLVRNLYVILTWIIHLKFPSGNVIFVFVYLAFIAVNYWWLVTRANGTNYIADFKDKAKAARTLWNVAALGLIALTFFGFIALLPMQ